MDHILRTVRFIFILAVAILAATGAASPVLAQRPTSANPSDDADRIAALEAKLKRMEERLEFLETKLGEGSASLVASTGALPAADLGSRAEPTILSAAAPGPAVAVTTGTMSQAAAAPFVQVGPKGFSIQSPEGDFRLGIRYQIHIDGRFAINRNEAADPNTFYLRRVQPILEGTVYRRFSYQLLTDFSQGNPRLINAYIITTITPSFSIQFGKFKMPVGIERFRSGMALPLMERALPSQLVPSRDVGVQFSGNLADSILSYAAGVFNGVPDGSSSDGNTDDHKESSGRLMTQPFVNSSVAGLKGLSIGVGGSYGEVEGNPASTNLAGYSSSGQREFFQYRSDGSSAGTVVADGVHYRLSPQGYYYVGPFGVMAEYVQSVQEVRRGSARATMNNSSWQVMTSYVLTGEKGSYDGVTAARPFDPEAGHWGAFEVAARYTALNPDSEAFPLFADPATAAREAKAWAVGLNWYLNYNLKLVLGYEQTKFEGAAPGVAFDTEKLFQQRFQLRF